MMVVLVTVVTVCLTVPSSCTSFTCVEVTTVSSEGLVLNAIVLANGSSFLCKPVVGEGGGVFVAFVTLCAPALASELACLSWTDPVSLLVSSADSASFMRSGSS
uniref:Putative secreted protein n=1 Tax=Ixodes ricinus TaxID=34613 RepID=A0A6B0UFU9_IXORI